MYIAETDSMNTTLDTMWEEHRDYLKRLLIGLSRDIDLTDDILQETYVRARAGMASYRGGDARAWLAAIAKNALRGHLRSPRVKNAVPMDEELSDRLSTDTGRALTLIHLREALRELVPSLRTALVMKHYGGFSYSEIAEHMDCPVGTAKWRVSSAIRQLRAALGVEEARKLTCSESRILDYLYGILPPDEAEEVKRHIESCEACRREAEEMRGVVNALDSLEGDYKMMHIVEIDPQGFTTVYCTGSVINNVQDTAIFGFEAEKSIPMDYIAIRGEELPFEVSQSDSCDHRYTYTIHLEQPWKRGESIEFTTVSYGARHQSTSMYRRAQFHDGRWHYLHQQAPSDDKEFIFIQVTRLPQGAKLLKADPAPDDVRANGTTTVTWKKVLAPNEQFECTVEYDYPKT